MKITAKVEGLTEAIAAFHGFDEKWVETVEAVLDKRGFDMVGYAQAEFRNAQETTSIATATRSGRLWRALRHRIDTVEKGVSLDLGYLKPDAEDDVLAYAATQEFGGHIVPVNVDWLTIPLDAMKTARGVARASARDLMDAGEETFFIPIQGGQKLLLMWKQDPHSDPVPAFLLVKEVKIPARPAIEPTFEHFIPSIIDEATEALAQLFAEDK